MSSPNLLNALTTALSPLYGVRPTERGAQLAVPFYFNDGDGLVVHVRPAGDGRLELTDYAHTLMHFGYHSDLSKLESGTRATLLEGIERRHRLEFRGGQLVRETSLESLRDDVADYVQAVLEVANLSNLDKEIVSSTFKEDLYAVLREAFPNELVVNYVDREHDPKAAYVLPYVLNGVSRPIAIFDVATDQNASDAVVVAGKHREWRPRIQVVAIERAQEELNKRMLAWLSDNLDKQFSALKGNETAIVDYLRREHELSRELDRAGARPAEED